MTSSSPLNGQTALITGSSSGIGKAIALQLAAHQCNLVLFARKLESLQEFKQQLLDRHSGITVQTYAVDVQHQSEVEKAVQQAIKESNNQRIDILINGAGLALGAPNKFASQSMSDIEQVIATNVNGTIYTTHAVLRQSMMKNPDDQHTDGKGTILNISSITGLVAPIDVGGEASYHTAKAALEGFNNVLRNELSETNVRLLTIRPGFVGGDSAFHSVRHNGSNEMKSKTFEGMEELTPEDVAESVIFMLSQPERVSIRSLDIVPTAQRSLYVNDRSWNKRNGIKQ